MDKLTEISIQQLKYVLNQLSDRRVSIVGTSCIGKSYLSRHIDGAIDMDNVLFSYLTREEEDRICAEPWTPEIGKFMEELAMKYLKVQPRKPIFGTVVLDCDYMIHLMVSDSLLMERVKSRKSNYTDCLNMANWIENRVKNSGIPHVDFLLG